MSTAKNPFYKTEHIARQETLEGLPLASFKARAIAMAIDLLLIGVLLLLMALVGLDIKSLVSFITFVLYFGVSTTIGHGATIGKRVVGIRVVSVVHEHISFWHAIERALGYSASSLEAGFGFIQFFTHPNRQTVHDRIAETIVITTRKGLPS